MGETGTEHHLLNEFETLHIASSEMLRAACDPLKVGNQKLDLLDQAGRFAEQATVIAPNTLAKMLVLSQFQAAEAMKLLVRNGWS